MLLSNYKRYISCLLALVMVLSILPVATFATEETHDNVTEETVTEPEPFVEEDSEQGEEEASNEATAEATEPSEEPEETTEEKLARFQDEMDAILIEYLGAAVLSENEIIDIVNNMTWDAMEAALAARDELEPEMTALTDEEIAQLEASYPGSNTIVCFYETIELTMDPATFAATSGTHTPVTGVTVDVSGATDNSMTDGVITVTAAGSNGFFGIGASAKTTTIAIKNDSGNQATIKFTVAKTNVNSLTTNAGTLTDTSFSMKMDAGATATLTLTTGKNSTENKVVLSDFQCVAVAAEAKATVTFDSAKGSVTLGGSLVANGDSAAATNGELAAVATPANDCSFLGWVNFDTNEILSTVASTTLNIPQNMNIQAVFVNSTSDTAWFVAGGAYLFNSLTDADNSAKTATNKTIILANNGTLSGSHTISSGVTLLIPYDDANTLCTTKPTVDATTGVLSATAAAWKKPSAYRTLIMASGAHITVNGAMSISGTQCAAQRYNGMPTGPLGFVTMENGSTITINSGAKLYVWGYITGSGTVTVKSGGIVYEDFQVRDWRGGTAASYMLNRDERVFPISQYYVQNVEVPMTLEAGAKEYGYMSLVASKIFGDTTVPFIGSDAMFVNSGSITKDYLESDDRLKVQINGDLTMSSLVLSVSSYDMDSSKYVLPITNSITVVINSGTTIISQDMALLPSAKIEIGQNAALQMADGISLFVYDLDEWDGKKYVYSLCDVSPLPYANKGSIATRAALGDATIIVNGTFDASKGYVYTTTGGSNICSTGEGTFISGTLGTSTITYQATQSGTTITFSEVAISPAKLKNADGSYVSTSATTYNYSSAHGKWYAGTHTETTNTTAATCTENGSTTTSCPCGWSTSTTISATGHSYGDWVISTAPTYDREGTQSRTCGCGDVQNRGLEAAAKVGDTGYAILKEAVDAAAGTSNAVTLLADISGDVTISQVVTVDKNGYTAAITAGDGYALSETSGIVTVWALIKLSGTSVTAGDSLDIYFYVDASELGDGTYDAEITRIKLEKDSGGAYTVEKTVTETIGSDQWASYGAYLRFSYNGIAAKEMTDLVSVTIYDANGKQISATVTESVESYTLRSLEKHTDTMLHTALVDMLNYGAAAQKYFGYKADDLANANLTAEQQALATTTVTCEDATTSSGNYSIAGATVTAESDLYFTFYFAGIPAEDVTGMNAVVSYTDHNGKSCEQTIAGSDFVSYGSYYGVCVTGLAVADGRVLLTCVLQKDGETVATATSSVESYIAVTIEQNTDVEGKENLVTLCNMLMRFIESAHDYFHRNDVSG